MGLQFYYLNLIERNLTVKILMKLTAPIVICILWLAYCDKKIIVSEYLLKRETQRLAEYAYFEGQKDAITGDVRIKYIEEDSCWVWTKSPWDAKFHFDWIIYDPRQPIKFDNKR
mgnify:CR=1 FL=1